MNATKSQSGRARGENIARMIIKKYPVLTEEKAYIIVAKVRKVNKGTLSGLKMSRIFQLVKQEMREYFTKEREKEKEIALKERKEKEDVDSTCPLCYKMFADKYSCNRHIRAFHSDDKSLMKAIGIKTVQS